MTCLVKYNTFPRSILQMVMKMSDFKSHDFQIKYFYYTFNFEFPGIHIFLGSNVQMPTRNIPCRYYTAFALKMEISNLLFFFNCEFIRTFPGNIL